MPESPARLTILQLTHQGEGAGSTQSIFSLSRELGQRGHRILVGCPAGTLLARSVAATPSLEHVSLDFSHFHRVADTLARVIADNRVDVVNSVARALRARRWAIPDGRSSPSWRGARTNRSCSARCRRSSVP